LRLTYIRDAACRKFERNVKSLNCLAGLRMLDIGCGAGLLCEPFTPVGRPGDRDRSVRHQYRGGKTACRQGPICRSTIAAPPAEEMDVRERFDIVLAMEVVEHVTDVGVSSTAARRCSSRAG